MGGLALVALLLGLSLAGISVWVLSRDRVGRRRAEAELAQVGGELRRLLHSTLEGICGIDREGRCTFLNRAGAEMLGHAASDLSGENVHARLHGRSADGTPHRAQDCPLGRAATAGETIRVEDDVLWRRNGTPVPVAYSVSPIREGGEVRGAVLTFLDITERKQIQATLHGLALIDDVTGLYNRRGFFNLATERAKRADLDGKPMLLLIVALADLPAIIGSLGMPAGEAAVTALAEILRETLRASDVFGRLRADVFGALAITDAEENAGAILARIRKRVAHWNASPPAPFTLSIRARIVPLYPSERDRLDEVVLDAEKSLEAAIQGDREGLAAAEA
jgi:PAS domain S-box-containing protein/diguanylate cyclase (GGDEF)-like protein